MLSADWLVLIQVNNVLEKFITRKLLRKLCVSLYIGQANYITNYGIFKVRLFIQKETFSRIRINTKLS